MPYSVDDILEKVEEKFRGNKRFYHIIGVRNLAVKLGEKLGLDIEKLEIAALLHDYAKYETKERQIELINDSIIVERFKDAKEIYHAYAGANQVEQELGIKDKLILDMIRYHVYGRIGMNIYEKVLVVSDFAEETRRYASCIRVRNLIDQDKPFDYIIYECIRETIDGLIVQGKHIMDEQYEILNELERELIKNGITYKN